MKRSEVLETLFGDLPRQAEEEGFQHNTEYGWVLEEGESGCALRFARLFAFCPTCGDLNLTAVGDGVVHLCPQQNDKKVILPIRYAQVHLITEDPMEPAKR